uniref:Uncharacterized protein n=1 Tax=Glossina morsitans morsitans TaxID=37546 RepID=A0A1B0GF03_GLOMM
METEGYLQSNAKANNDSLPILDSDDSVRWRNLGNLKTESIGIYLNDDIIEAEKWSGGQSVAPMEFSSAKSNLDVGRPNAFIKEFRKYFHRII